MGSARRSVVVMRKPLNTYGRGAFQVLSNQVERTALVCESNHRRDPRTTGSGPLIRGDVGADLLQTIHIRTPAPGDTRLTGTKLSIPPRRQKAQNG